MTAMSDWKEWFEHHEHCSPNVKYIGIDHVATNYWEQMYQAFKSRMEEEHLSEDDES